MSDSRDDQRPVDEFAAEDDLSIEDLTEDDPWAAFAAEPAAAQPKREVPPSHAQSTWRPASAGLTVATLLMIAAAGAYLFLPEPEGLKEQIAAVIDNPSVPTAGADADGRSVPATEVIVSAAAETATEPAPPVRVNGAKTPSSQTRPPAAAQRPSTSDTNPAAVVDDADNSAPLSGDWVMSTRVESSQLQRYEGLRLGYVVNLRQDGDRISGTGWKVREDDRTISASSRTPINFDGVMNADRVELTFTEGGRLRTTAGKLVLARDSDDVLRGRISSTAAQSVGIVEIRR